MAHNQGRQTFLKKLENVRVHETIIIPDTFFSIDIYLSSTPIKYIEYETTLTFRDIDL